MRRLKIHVSTIHLYENITLLLKEPLMQGMLGIINREEITSIQCGFVAHHSNQI